MIREPILAQGLKFWWNILENDLIGNNFKQVMSTAL